MVRKVALLHHSGPLFLATAINLVDAMRCAPLRRYRRVDDIARLRPIFASGWRDHKHVEIRHATAAALAHVVGNKVEAAYQRGDLFDKRRHLMDEWARYCGVPASTGDTVVPLKA